MEQPIKDNVINEYINYMDYFYDSPFSAYDFMCLFCSVNFIRENYVFKYDNLVEFIIKCKDENKFNHLLDDIHFKNNGINYYSNDLLEAISTLKVVQVLYTVSPETDDSINIYEYIDVAGLLKNRLTSLGDMVKFTSEYIKYDLEKNEVKEKVYK